MDRLTLDRIALLHPSLRTDAILIYNEICQALSGNAFCRFAFTLRTNEEQAQLYAQGRTKLFDGKGNRLGIVTNAKPGQSMHNYGLAVDIALVVDENRDGVYETASWNTTRDFDGDGKSDWMECVAIFKKHGWEWGGDWHSLKDLPHFQKVGGLTWQALIKKKKDACGYVIL